MKLDDKLQKLGNDIGGQLAIDKMYRNFAYMTFAILFIVTFFISLANAEFDFYKILQARFWIDSLITLGGSLIIKFTFGKYGNSEGNKNKEVQLALEQIKKDNQDIEDNNLSTDLKIVVDRYNENKKLNALKAKTYEKLNKNSKSKKWKKIKCSIKIYEDLLVEKDENKKLELIEKLNENNFSLDNFKIKYDRISEASLQTGLPIENNENQKMSFNEMYELFGKQIYMTIITIVFTILLASSSILMETFNIKTIIIFLSRVLSYALNAFMGFIIAKNAVETIKLNVLKLIHTFLKRFLELMRGENNGR